MKRLILILYWFLLAHVIVSVTFILDPPFLASTEVARIYKTYLLPGPFFAQARIVNNYSLLLSWKANGVWSTPINHAKENFVRYTTTFDPRALSRSRLDRALYLKPILSDSTPTGKGFNQLTRYLHDHYVPVEADSIRIVIFNEQAKDWRIRADTVHFFISR